MKQFLGLAGISVALLLLSGCASDGNTRYANEQKFVVDQAYVSAVNRASRRSGVQVTWVNPPAVRAPVDGGTGN